MHIQQQVRESVVMTREEAEEQISKILKQLEIDTHCLIRQVDINDVDVTKYGDTFQQIQRYVSIKIDPMPGSNWGQ